MALVEPQEGISDAQRDRNYLIHSLKYGPAVIPEERRCVSAKEKEGCSPSAKTAKMSALAEGSSADYSAFSEESESLQFSTLALDFLGPESERNSESSNEDKERFKNIGLRHRLVFKMLRNDSKLVKTILHSYGFNQGGPHSFHFNFLWTGTHLKAHCLRNLTEYQRVNHFPRSFELTRKDRLYRNIERMQLLHGKEDFDFIPEFYVTPTEFSKFAGMCRKPQPSVKAPFIVKPVGSSRGRGIFLATHPDQIPLGSPMLVSRYINNPYLINGYKFDLRFYVAVTSFHPLVTYLYHEGLVRFAVEKYTVQARNYSETHVHLTNYSLNKFSKRYVRNTEIESENIGHKWTLGALLRQLKAKNVDTELVMLRIEDVIVKTLMSCQSSVAAACLSFVPYANNCFELFGFDILLDANLKPWLLEVNLSPSLSCDSPLDLKVKSLMMCDLLTLARIPLHCPYPPEGQRAKSAAERRLVSARKRTAELGTRSAKQQRALMLKRQALHAVGKLPPLTKNRSEKDKAMAHLHSVQEEWQIKGGFQRIFPRLDTWAIYGDFLPDLGSNFDLDLHMNLFSEELKEGKLSAVEIEEAAGAARDALMNMDKKSSLDLDLKTKSFIQESLSRCRLYQEHKDCTELRRVSLPRMTAQDRKRTRSFLALNVDGKRPINSATSGDVSDLVMTHTRDLDELTAALDKNTSEEIDEIKINDELNNKGQLLSLVQVRMLVHRCLDLILSELVSTKVTLTPSTKEMLTLTGIFEPKNDKMKITKDTVLRLRTFIDRYSLYTKRLKAGSYKNGNGMDLKVFQEILRTADRKQLEQLLLGYYKNNELLNDNE